MHLLPVSFCEGVTIGQQWAIASTPLTNKEREDEDGRTRTTLIDAGCEANENNKPTKLLKARPNGILMIDGELA